MSVIVVGLEQRNTPLELLERVSVTEEALPKALGCLRDRSNLSEAVLLSTCLRTEVYAVVERFHDGVAELQEFLATIAGSQPDTLAEHSDHPLRRRRGPPPLHRGRRSRLGRHRGVRGARTGPAGLGAGAGGARLRSRARRPVPPCGRDRQAGPIRDGHRPGHHVAVPWGGGPGRPAEERRTGGRPRAGDRSGGDGRGNRPGPARARHGERGHRQPHRRPARGLAGPAARRRGRLGSAPRRSTGLAGQLAVSDVVFTSIGTTHPIIDRAMLEAAVGRA